MSCGRERKGRGKSRLVDGKTGGGKANVLANRQVTASSLYEAELGEDPVRKRKTLLQVLALLLLVLENRRSRSDCIDRCKRGSL